MCIRYNNCIQFAKIIFLIQELSKYIIIFDSLVLVSHIIQKLNFCFCINTYLILLIKFEIVIMIYLFSKLFFLLSFSCLSKTKRKTFWKLSSCVILTIISNRLDNKCLSIVFNDKPELNKGFRTSFICWFKSNYKLNLKQRSNLIKMFL